MSFVVRPRSEQPSAAGAHRQETELTARVLGRPFGQLLVGTVGAVLVASGVGFGYQAATTEFQERLKKEQTTLSGHDDLRLSLLGVQSG